MMLAVQFRAIKVEVEIAGISRHFDDFHAFDQFFARAPKMNKVGDGANFKPMLFGELDQVSQASHGAVLFEYLADNGDGPAASEAGQIDRGFSVSGALQDSSWTRSQWKNVAGLDEIVRHGRGLGHDANGFRAVRSADTSRNPTSGIDTDLKIGFERLAILADHSFDAQ